jgi:hypothetical protein
LDAQIADPHLAIAAAPVVNLLAHPALWLGLYCAQARGLDSIFYSKFPLLGAGLRWGILQNK